jgi:hypothetical protein
VSNPVPPTRIRRSGALRGVAMWSVLIGTALSAVGCGSGFDAASLQVKPDSGSAQIGALKINGVVVVADPATGDAEVVAAVANTGPGSNRLVSVTADGLTATVRPALSASPLAGLPGNNVTPMGNTVTIAGGSSVSFGQPGRPALEITDGSFVPGRITQVEFGFADVGQTTVTALVMSNTGLFKSYDLGPAQSPSPSPSSSVRSSSSASASAGASASLAASSNAVASPSLSPSPSATPVVAVITASATASNPAGGTPAKASTTLVRSPHLHGSREPRS